MSGLWYGPLEDHIRTQVCMHAGTILIKHNQSHNINQLIYWSYNHMHASNGVTHRPLILSEKQPTFNC